VLKGCYDYSWVVGFAAGFVIYLVLAPLSARAKASGAAALSTGAAGG
jgi:cytosine/uracil/thiamine/allantoin permease